MNLESNLNVIENAISQSYAKAADKSFTSVLSSGNRWKALALPVQISDQECADSY